MPPWRKRPWYQKRRPGDILFYALLIRLSQVPTIFNPCTPGGVEQHHRTAFCWHHQSLYIDLEEDCKGAGPHLGQGQCLFDSTAATVAKNGEKEILKDILDFPTLRDSLESAALMTSSSGNTQQMRQRKRQRVFCQPAVCLLVVLLLWCNDWNVNLW